MFFRVLLIFLVLFQIQSFQFEKDFQANIKVKSRQNPQYELNGKVEIKNGEIRSTLMGQGDFFYYENGKLLNHKEDDSFCVDKSDTPPFFNFFEILKTLKPLEHETFDNEVNKCHKKWNTVYNGEFFVVCEENGTFTKIIGENLLISIQILPKIYQKLGFFYMVDKCEQNILKPEILIEKKPWYEKEEICRLDWLSDESKCPKNKYKPDKTCIFFHGSGERVTGPPLNEHSEYWGPLNRFTPHCKVRRYIREETKMRGWNDEGLQKIYCKEATFDQQDKTIIRNKIIYTHSMGGLVVAGAIRNKFCDIDTKTSSWYTIAPAYQGSHLVKFVRNVCERKDPGVLPQIYRYISEFFGYCIPGKDELYPVYETLDLDYSYMKELVEISLHRLNGSLCGDSAYGLNTVFSIPLSIVASYANFPEHSDGLVPISSCQIVGKRQGKTFGETPDEMYYKPSTNHPDNTCRHGDGLWGNTRKPCSYFLNKF